MFIAALQMSALALLCAAATLHPVFGTPRFRAHRTAMYATLGLTAVVFIVHGIALHGAAIQARRMALVWMGWMALANLLGAVVFAARVSEGV